MIRYDLVCPAGHGFDGWFRSSADFDAQARKTLLSCPHCGSPEVAKALMAPAVSTRKRADPAPEPAPAAAPAEAPTGVAPESAQPLAMLDHRQAKIRDMLRDLRKALVQNSEDVGTRFPDLARKMHAQEIEQRSIHGRATPDEAKALADEGVEIHPLPTFPDELN